MDEQPIALAGTQLVAGGTGALWWPEARLLVVSDLHLGRSERLARRGGTLLPPYETAATLDRLATEIANRAPARVICLGDSFDDTACADALDARDLDRLTALIAGRDWIWIAGNHDPGPLTLPGRHLAEYVAGPLTFRHIATPDAAPGEISGHYHPKTSLALRTGRVSRPCFVLDDRRLILPAFGAYTGGLRTDSPALAALIGPGARAILTGTPCVTVPLACAAPARRAG